MKKLYHLSGILLCRYCISLAALLFLFLILAPVNGRAQVNAYAKVTAITTTSGKSMLTLGNIDQTHHTFAVGEDVIVIQMQDNVIGAGTNASFGMLSSIASAGLYEIATINALTPGTITLTSLLHNSFIIGSNSSVQVVSFTKLLDAGSTTNYSTIANITAVPWNGSLGTGGVIAFQVPGTLTLKHSVSADGQGFTGGAASGNYNGGCEPSVYTSVSTGYAGKGEGIYLINTGLNPSYVRARARILSGGGGASAYKAGGAGGSNYSAGGDGGSSWLCDGANVSGGLGGIALNSYLTTGTRLFMGGGGGGGQGTSGTQTAGAKGGGIIIIKAGTLTTNCSSSLKISANGNSAADAASDGAGGGGAAGTILLQVAAYSVPAGCPLTIQANGGNGGDATNLFPYGGGGGGGQGSLIFSAALPSNHITTVTTPGNGGSNGNGWLGGGSAPAGAGSNNAGIVVGVGTILPVRLTYFSVENKNNQALLRWTSAGESNVTYHIQHATDGISFTPIGTVTGTGNGTANYSFTDPNTVSGRNYYRLEIIEAAATKAVYSSIVSINLSDLLTLPVAYPNPAHDHFYIRMNGGGNGKTYMISISDLTGHTIYTTNSKTADNVITVTPGKPLKPGLYLFKVSGYGMEETGKLIIQ